MRDATEHCYYETVSQQLLTYAQAMTWLAGEGLLARTPRYDPAKDEAEFVRALETLCGAAARGKVLSREGTLGIDVKWMGEDHKGRNGRTAFCLMQGARVAGYELRGFDS
jgi:hypothetical protein